MRRITADIAFAWRMLFKKKLFAFVTLLTLAICIGGNVFVFSILDSFVLRPLQHPESDRLVEVYNSYPGYQHWRGASSFINYKEYKESISAFEDTAFVDKKMVNVQKGDIPMSVRGHDVSAEFFRVLKAKPYLGRTLDERDFVGEGYDSAMISYNLWNKLFKGQGDAVGQTIKLDGKYHTIVGIMPKGFYYEETDVQVWRPYYIPEYNFGEYFRHRIQVSVIARLAEGYSVRDASAQIEKLNKDNYEKIATKENRDAYDIGGFETIVWLLKNRMSETYQSNLFLLQAGVLIMLLIGCVNVSNLLMVRSNERMAEFAVRGSIGARRSMILSLVMTESMILCLLGGAGGLVLGVSGILAFDNVYALRHIFNIELTIDFLVIAFTIGLAVLAGFVCGGFSLFNVWKGGHYDSLKEDGGSSTSSKFVGYMTSGLVVLQLALTFALSYSAALLFISFKNTMDADLGFDPKNLYTGLVNLSEQAYPDYEDLINVTDRIQAEVAKIPGVQSVSLTRGAPFITNGIYLKQMDIKSMPEKNAVSRIWRGTENMFETWGLELVEGRFLQPTDTVDNGAVAVIDTFTADRYFPDGALGHKIHLPYSGLKHDSDGYITIVGVVNHVKMRELDMLDEREKGISYFSYKQAPYRFVSINVKTTLREGSLRGALQNAVLKVDPELPVYDLQPQQRRIDFHLFKRRMFMATFVICSVMAIVLSVLGVFGLVSYSCSLRTKEIGIRKSLGARRMAILKLMLVVGIKRIAIGIALGVVVVMMMSGSIKSFLFGIAAFDPLTLIAVSLWILTIGLAATYIPSFAASRAQPMRALAVK